ncbi:TIGR03619 family F420-dependent LLM class oxidoreductase [Gordonia sp. NPDC058843]|uniref:TIGR03619 family F420-dependent LLM class oxidoreductase n=1 Tax=Gordonia sp. NPDC058843 TaxID=3346648 RepID=UPI00369F4354
MNFYISTAYLPVAEIHHIARAADRLGYRGLAIPEHVVNFAEQTTPYPYTRDGATRWDPFTPWPDPWVLIGSLSQCTEHLRFVTTVSVPALRDPFTAAKSIGTAALISAGRVELGVGVGWNKDEFELLGADFEGRGRRTDEMLTLMRSLWAPGWTEFDGEMYSTPRIEMSPSPPHVPIYVGGLSARALRRAAFNDGWIGDLTTTAAAIQVAGTLAELRRSLGREDHDFTIIAPLTDALSVDDYRTAERGGITDILTMPWMFYSGANSSTEQKIAGMERFVADIVTPLQRKGGRAQLL